MTTVRILKALGVSLALLAVSACSSTANIRSDHDPNADFGAYQSYNFMANAGPNNGQYESFFTQYMKAAIDVEMQNRGYTRSDNPDLLVNFNAILQEKTKISTTPAMPPPGGYYGYRGGYYSAWGGYGWGSETQVSQYTEGTFNIDLVDARRQQLVWEAVGVGRVSQKTIDNLEEAVKAGVPRFFAHYPYRAGDPNPVYASE